MALRFGIQWWRTQFSSLHDSLVSYICLVRVVCMFLVLFRIVGQPLLCSLLVQGESNLFGLSQALVLGVMFVFSSLLQGGI
jgi:hypothetical protein